jgi:hypothetical protein
MPIRFVKSYLPSIAVKDLLKQFPNTAVRSYLPENFVDLWPIFLQLAAAVLVKICAGAVCAAAVLENDSTSSPS